MRTSEGREFAFLGRDPDDAEVCMWTTTSGRGVSRQVRGLWSATAETSRFHREGLRQLFPLGPSKTASYTSATNRGFWRYNWRVLGEQRVTVPAGEFDVWVLEFSEDSVNNLFRGERIFYVDKATHTPVRVDSRVVRGMSSYTPSWQAVTFTRPGR
ncbi:DUF3108 domain-containing protein [Roseomonas sp. HF4]|uniref:DUF3108 domain-containing protein n=1 Tax=Roseomonas sp. HF4 TaxID=2562313 RepID=UPI0010C0395C|nr:DUF3108 domain-containing protein [Roseomonas sp. HF4]